MASHRFFILILILIHFFNIPSFAKVKNPTKKNIDYAKTNQQLKAEKIEFYYPEQQEFQFKNFTTNCDAEAFFVYDNQLHIFTKEWSNMATTHYVVPIDTTKKHAAKKLGTFKTNYAVTAA